ncbi:hypothetical protein F383_24459 [Gossypium arboreum]|uniref:Uncharacterized protein n=1 Tax=Gossypium arboreum TaxID=29729 RepID=A0A0B0MQ88_GOSAR|nr:hypothetical protein F383_24459 [Gossypium arboreum]
MGVCSAMWLAMCKARPCD